MNTLAPPASSSASPRLWRDPPRRTGLARCAGAAGRFLTLARDRLLERFIDVLGSLSSPGSAPVGRLQAWALRRMGVTCRSDQIWLGPDVRFDWPQHLVLGARVTLNPGTRLTCHELVELGDDFLAAPGLLVNSGTHDLATLQPAAAPVRVGRGVWCGARVTIGAGVTIGDGAVVGAGSVVVRDLPAHHVSLGVPARPQRDLRGLRQDSAPRWSNFRP
jgi:acetyltransferase-like isoleucine patch superfamily enzyme